MDASVASPPSAGSDGDPPLTAGERRRIAAATHPAYRADIDGLRAVAVGAVVLYHAGVRGFSGGFVGVDVFFVISGYLITAILVRDVAVGRHSVAEFYRRRVLRIFPALFAMLAAVTLAACVVLLPSEVGRYARSLGATALFGSNILFYAETDYFGPQAITRPLLPTWSLAVEEQWYILWPLVVAAVGAARPALLKVTTLGVVLLFFALGAWLVGRDAAAAFYLLPARAWELGLGAILAIWSWRVPRGRAADALAALGLVLILAAVKLYTHETRFPGLAALPPCLGAALVIAAGNRGRWVGRALGWGPVRFVGLISYSLYLWHWPVIVFADIGLFLPRSAPVQAGEILVSLLIAILSWRFVEQPFRHGVAGWRTSRVLAWGAAAIGAALLLALAVPMLNRLALPVTPRQATIGRVLDFDGNGAFRRGTCFVVRRRGAIDPACLRPDGTAPTLLLMGDSYAAHLWPGLARANGRFDVLQATATGCVPRLYAASDRSFCAEQFGPILRDRLRARPPAALVLAGRWQMPFLPALEAMLRDPAVRAAHPVLVGPMPEHTAALPRLLVMAEVRGDPGLVRRSQSAQPFAVDRVMRALAARTGTPYVSMTDLLCPGGACRVWAAPDVPLQFDTGHLTREGSAAVADMLAPRIAAAALTTRAGL